MDKIHQWLKSHITQGGAGVPRLCAVEMPTKVRYDVSTASGGPEPSGFVDAMAVAMNAASTLRRFGTVVRTDKTATVTRWPRYSNSSLGEIVSEAGVGSVGSGVFGSVVGSGVKFSTEFVKVSRELFDDMTSAEENLGRILGTQLAATQQKYFTDGTGSDGQPNGLKNATSAGATATAVDAILKTELQTLVGSVNEAYRERGRFMMHADILAAIESVKDATTDEPVVKYVWTPNGVKAHVLGYEVVLNDFLPDTLEAGEKALWFGGFETFGICEFEPPYIAVNRELFAATDQLGLFVTQRADCGLLVADGIQHLVMAAE